MEFANYFKKTADKTYTCTIKVKETEDADETERGEKVTTSKDSFWNLKRHISRRHEETLRQHNGRKSKR